MELDRYLDRIGYAGPYAVDEATLHAVVAAHTMAIAYENLDVFLERPVTTDVPAALRKIVDQGRGGWCYEMNGALGWALAEIGFAVTRMVGAVNEEAFGPETRGNHLVLRVDLDETWIVDAGLGGALVHPFLLVEGPFEQAWRQFRVEHVDGAHWRFHNRPGAMPASFDWIDAPADEQRLALVCQQLQDDADSLFRQNLLAIHSTPDTSTVLMGKVLVDTRTGAKQELTSEGHLMDVLTTHFGLSLPDDCSGLWERVEARHATLFD